MPRRLNRERLCLDARFKQMPLFEVYRGDCRSFEPLITAVLDAALSADWVVATRLRRIPA
jgi:hypothetical protein